MKAVLIVYDIPADRKIRNPSGRLRRVGVRLNLSAWMVREEHIPWDLLGEMRAAGARVETVRFDERDADRIKALARGALEDEARRIRETLGKSLTEGAAKVAAKAGEAGTAESVSLYRKRVTNRAKKLLAAAREAALLFDLTAEVAALMTGVEAAIRAEVENGTARLLAEAV